MTQQSLIKTITMIEKKQKSRLTFRLYDMTNPIIWERFEQYALKLINQGVEKYGSKSIIEVVRFHAQIDGRSIQVNNIYTPDYARKFITKYPQYNNFFEFRNLKRIKR
jgi:hypothetical protein